MIEKINTEEYKWVSTPSIDVIDALSQLIEQNRNNPIAICEVGVGVGATAVGIVGMLRDNDSYSMYSFDRDVKELELDLNRIKKSNVMINAYGNTEKTYDSYVWSLSKVLLEMKKTDKDGIYDLVYLDGAHDIFHDVAACCILKKLILNYSW